MNRKEDGKQVTRWLRGADKEPSGHAGGKAMLNGAWLVEEMAALDRKGVEVRIVENPAMPGYYALFRG